jgi:hypothetical protein
VKVLAAHRVSPEDCSDPIDVSSGDQVRGVLAFRLAGRGALKHP